MKNTLEGSNSRTEDAEEWIKALEDSTIGSNEVGHQKEKRI